MTGGRILTEAGDFLLSEGGQQIVTEDYSPTPPSPYDLAMSYGGNAFWKRKKQKSKRFPLLYQEIDNVP